MSRKSFDKNEGDGGWGHGGPAAGKTVTLHGATVMQQVLPLGLVDEIRVHVIPVRLDCVCGALKAAAR